MVLDQRCMAILNKVVYASAYVSPSEIMEELKISKRTVYYDVEKINGWLKDQDIELLSYVRSAGFYLSEEGKKRVKEKLGSFDKKKSYEFSPRERMTWAAILILTRENKIFLQDLLEQLNVSRSTLLSDMKQLKAQLIPFHVQLKFQRSSGYYIEGQEQDKRKLLLYFLSQVMTNRNWNELLSEIQMTVHSKDPLPLDLLQQSDLERIYEIINECERFTGVHYTDEVIQALSAHLFLLIKRFTQGKYIQMDPVEKEVIQETTEYQAAHFICQKVESVFRVSVPEDEVFYLTTYLLGAKISDYRLSEVENQQLVHLKQMIKLMVDDFQKLACVFFQNRQELERNLYIHLKPAFFRIKYGIEYDHPLSESLKHTYHDLFVLTKKVVHHFEYVLGKPVSDDEIAYIAMHFGGWLDKEGVKVAKRKKAMVVCASGIGTSRILQKQIEDLLPTVDVVQVLTVREYEKVNLAGMDFVISTTPLEEKGRPVYVVHPILNHAEKTFLLKQIQSTSDGEGSDIEALLSIIRKYADIHQEEKLYQELKSFYQIKKEKMEVKYKPMLNELLTIDKIQFADKTESWEEAIRMAAKPLVADQSIQTSYVEAMIENVKEMGPYIVIAPGIALPHARPDAGVNKLGMSFLRLKESCSFSDKPDHQVHLFFVLAAVDNETHLKALSQLSNMLSDGTTLEKLKTAQTAGEVEEIINQFSKE
ncbi:BglG family transcription antiterminator [Neobacillus sedimentimangrovi]|uniref:BglG family transcription antiterminator n=1 Tax=Neobacillus sedimentimangrovi TaxID=2699460 RepID=A0ABS8QHS4_9BACI|nr:BglG family transcription antiterminator [Neobacillus sedimentimangrovi]MCD4838345.1 BglG family transcription antiterminator [Neobacillus sedimentimangrovi]